MIEIQNRIKNLLPEFTDANYNEGTGSYDYLNEWKNGYLIIKNGSINVSGLGCKIPIKPNIPYTLAYKGKLLKPNTLRFTIEEDLGVNKLQTSMTPTDNYQVWNFTYTYNDLKRPYKYLRFLGDGTTSNTEIWLYDLILLEGTYSADEIDTLYTEPKPDKIQLNTELFGYAGVFDEYLGDGKVLRRWKKVDTNYLSAYIESDTLTNVYLFKTNPFSDSKQSYDNGSIILKHDGSYLKYASGYSLDYEHWYYEPLYDRFYIAIDKSIIDAENGSSLNEKGNNYFKKMTIIYQLATPQIEEIQPSGELNLYPGDNYILTPDYGIISIEGDKKYLYG